MFVGKAEKEIKKVEISPEILPRVGERVFLDHPWYWMEVTSIGNCLNGQYTIRVQKYS